MAVWKNIKCPGCKKPNDREDLKQRDGRCIYCGFKITSNLNSFTKNELKLSFKNTGIEAERTDLFRG